jgi:hypothetical protein
VAPAAGNGAAPPKSISFARLVQYLLELARGEFYGSVHIQFRRGQIGMVKREETFVENDALPVDDLESVRMMETGRSSLAAT